jgi:hypothetical protein
MYTTEDGVTKIQATFDNDTVWLSIDQMAELFQRDKSTISRHIKNIFEEGEYVSDSVVANFATTASDGKTYQVDYYNAYLDIAEVRALNHEPMYMHDWLETIDEYLKMTRREILTTAGHISHQAAIEKAHDEYKKYKTKQIDNISLVEKHFLESIGKLENKVENKS